MTVYTVAGGKGGITKSTTAAELAYRLAQEGRDVLLVELDQQGNASARFGITPDSEVEGTTADVLRAESTIREAAASTRVPNVSVLVGTHELIAVEENPPVDVVTVIRDSAELGEWDDVVIDSPPSLGRLASTGLAAAEVLIVPVPPEVEAYQQIERLEAVLTGPIGKRVNPGVRIDWTVPTMHDGRRLLDREIVELLEDRMPGRVAPTVRHSVMVRDAYTAGMTVSEYDPSSPVAEDYRRATTAIIKEGGSR
ncbi:ParA family protein [Isoptericola rhizosphaerae]|uniref:ParA family protein n=1 Tax=Isoptericola rhizosphaerae TaxID=3377837 RepID=UPI00383A795E